FFPPPGGGGDVSSPFGIRFIDSIDKGFPSIISGGQGSEMMSTAVDVSGKPFSIQSSTFNFQF
ncbi:hypothetical protein, partial [Vibrio parahaemolyticus]|uniref:hypothetical protein n=2 Tax=Vibrio parahaemolyticus TaxID=670 RepID=UPI001E3A7436